MTTRTIVRDARATGEDTYLIRRIRRGGSHREICSSSRRAGYSPRYTSNSPNVANSFFATAMNILEFTILVAAGSFIAGLLGSLTGLGGGVVLVPLLTLFFKVDIRYAIGASLVSVIATSSGAAAAYVKEGFSNIRIGMFLEIATTLGALAGAFSAVWVSTKAIAIVFGVVLLVSAFLSRKPD